VYSLTLNGIVAHEENSEQIVNIIKSCQNLRLLTLPSNLAPSWDHHRRELKTHAPFKALRVLVIDVAHEAHIAAVQSLIALFPLVKYLDISGIYNARHLNVRLQPIDMDLDSLVLWLSSTRQSMQAIKSTLHRTTDLRNLFVRDLPSIDAWQYLCSRYGHSIEVVSILSPMTESDALEAFQNHLPELIALRWLEFANDLSPPVVASLPSSLETLIFEPWQSDGTGDGLLALADRLSQLPSLKSIRKCGKSRRTEGEPVLHAIGILRTTCEALKVSFVEDEYRHVSKYFRSSWHF
jgi:hypothetical protein